MKIMLNPIKSYSAFGNRENAAVPSTGTVQAEEHNDTFEKGNKTNVRLSETDTNEFVEFYFGHDEDNKQLIRMLLEDKAERYGTVLEKIDEIEAQEAERLAKRGTIKGMIEDIETAILELMMLTDEEVKPEEIYGLLEYMENNPADSETSKPANKEKAGIFQKISSLFSRK